MAVHAREPVRGQPSEERRGIREWVFEEVRGDGWSVQFWECGTAARHEWAELWESFWDCWTRLEYRWEYVREYDAGGYVKWVHVWWNVDFWRWWHVWRINYASFIRRIESFCSEHSWIWRSEYVWQHTEWWGIEHVRRTAEKHRIQLHQSQQSIRNTASNELIDARCFDNWHKPLRQPIRNH